MSFEPVTQDMALQAARTWLGRVSDPAAAAGRMGVVIREALELDDGYPGLFVISDGAGVALVAGDMQAQPILGWTTRGDFHEMADAPPGLAELVSAWGRQILLTRQAPPERAAAANPNRDAWMQLLDESARAQDEEPVKEIAPLLSARWGQGAGWNADCPIDAAGPGGRAYAGCVATAMGQVLHFHQHPWRGQHVQGYDHDVYGPIDLDMLEEAPEWKAMLDAGATSAAARLLYMAGVAVRMNYGPRTSTASSGNIVTALKSFLRYQDAARLVWRASTPAEEWEALIQEELAAGRPIIHRGQGAQGGHAFNLDGWRSDGFKHLNFGWNGTYNGWYTLDSITPGYMDFSGTQGMVVGIAPRLEDLLNPPDGQHNVSPDAVSLRWRPRDGMARIELEVALNALFMPTVRRVVLTSGLVQHTLTRLAPNTRHFWRLTFIDKTGRRIALAACSFVTGPSLTTTPGKKPGTMVNPGTPEAIA
ncbi:MAG: C10 family peptidase [Candidatus Delongbacteria bacterium]